MKEKEITHSGLVSTIHNGVVYITIEASSACAGCHAKGSCTMSETEEKIVEIGAEKHPDLKVGEEVTVVISREAGIFAVIMAYLVPVLLVIASLWIFELAKMEELLSFAIMLLIVALYYVLLYLFRNKILNKINIRIKR